MQHTVKEKVRGSSVGSHHSVYTSYRIGMGHRKREGREKAAEWIDQQMVSYLHLLTVLQWSKDMFENNGSSGLYSPDKDTGIRILKALSVGGK